MSDPHDIQIYDRIKELTYTLGTGDFLLAGEVPGFSSFSSVYVDQANLFYAITDGVRYEIGSGVYVSGVPNRIKRFPLRSSQGANTAVNFPEGTKEIYVTYPATHAVYSASGIKNYSAPKYSGVAYWFNDSIINYDSALVWDDTNKRLGINNPNPLYAIDVGGPSQTSIINVSGLIVGKSGIYFPPYNDEDILYPGGRQLRHYEPNRLDDYAVQNGVLGQLTGTSAVLELSGIANNYILFKRQAAGLVFAGPPSGCSPPCSPSHPSFRPLTVQDIPNLSGLYSSYSFVASVSGNLNNKINDSNANTVAVSSVLNNKISALQLKLSNGQKGDLTIYNNGDLFRVSPASIDSSKIANGSVTIDKLSFVPSLTNGGRLTLDAFNPVSIADLVNRSTLYFVPYKNNKIALYNGSHWEIVNFNNIALTLAGLEVGALYDVFASILNGNVALLTIKWINSQTRSALLSRKDGVLCTGSNFKYRYLGTFRASSTNGITDSKQNRNLWNFDNRVQKPIYHVPSIPEQWSDVPVSSMRKLGNNQAFEISVVNGFVEDSINLEARILVSSSGNSSYFFGLGSGDLPSPATNTFHNLFSGSGTQTLISALNNFPALGFSKFYPIESGSSSSVTAYLKKDGLIFGGINGLWNC